MDIHSVRRISRPRPIAGRLSITGRLSLLMLVVYATPGAIVPLFSLRLEQLGFSPTQIGWCCATQALGSLIAPLIAGHIADRWCSPERCLTFTAFTASIALWLLAALSQPAAVFIVALFFWLAMAPSLTLTTSICFAHLRDGTRQFGRVRMWGTVGWVAPGWLIGLWLAEGDLWSPVMHWLRPEQPHPELADAFRVAAALAALFGVYALTLPRTAPRKSQDGAAPLAAIRALKSRAFYIYAICTFGVCVALPFHTQVTPLLFKSLNVPAAWIAPLLTVAQVSEVLSLFALPIVYARLGTRSTMRLGLLATIVTLSGLMIGRPLGVAVAGLALYGFCISFYLVVGQMFLHQRSRDDIRSSAQALHSVLCGMGLLVGNVLIGQVRRGFGGAFPPTYAIAAALAVLLFGVFIIGFPRDEKSAARRSA